MAVIEFRWPLFDSQNPLITRDIIDLRLLHSDSARVAPSRPVVQLTAGGRRKDVRG